VLYSGRSWQRSKDRTAAGQLPVWEDIDLIGRIGARALPVISSSSSTRAVAAETSISYLSSLERRWAEVGGGQLSIPARSRSTFSPCSWRGVAGVCPSANHKARRRHRDSRGCGHFSAIELGHHLGMGKGMGMGMAKWPESSFASSSFCVLLDLLLLPCSPLVTLLRAQHRQTCPPAHMRRFQSRETLTQLLPVGSG